VTLAGFSFGSRVVSRLGCGMEQAPARVILAGFPTRLGAPDYLERCTSPKFFVQSTNDPFGPRAELEALFARVSEPKHLYWVEASDHFFAGGLEAFEDVVVRLEP